MALVLCTPIDTSTKEKGKKSKAKAPTKRPRSSSVDISGELLSSSNTIEVLQKAKVTMLFLFVYRVLR